MEGVVVKLVGGALAEDEQPGELERGGGFVWVAWVSRCVDVGAVPGLGECVRGLTSKPPFTYLVHVKLLNGVKLDVAQHTLRKFTGRLITLARAVELGGLGAVVEGH